MSRIVSSAGVLSHEPPTDGATTPETGDNKYLAWTSHDLAFLETHYGVMKTTELAEKLGCTIVSVRVTGGRLEREKTVMTGQKCRKNIARSGHRRNYGFWKNITA